jgi:hypothetical protein
MRRGHNDMTKLLLLLYAMTLVSAQRLDAAQATVRAVNRLTVARPRQTLELTRAQLSGLGLKELNAAHVQDSSGADVLCQAVDTDRDAYHKPDVVIFQTDFGPGETKTFTVSAGAKNTYRRDQFKAFGRFVRERFDDFAWENDRVAHRMYGKALETWAGEPLTSSTVDIWSKRTARLVVNDWYLVDDYHTDHGDGADFYSAGASRGCGGSGIWDADRLWTSRNFTNSRVLANGPIRVMFELEYEPFDVNGKKLRETKRIWLDAGAQLDTFQSTYQWDASEPGRAPVVGIGIKKTAGAIKAFDSSRGTLQVWEPVAKNTGMQGVGVVVKSEDVQGESQDKLSYLILAKCGAGLKITYWAGFCWDKAGVLTTAEDWKSYLERFAQGLTSPIEVTATSD